MTKKNWLNPELMGLGLENTKEDGYEQVTTLSEGNEKILWKCINCGAISPIIPDMIHLSWCPKVNDPARPGGNLDGGFDIGTTPIS